MKEFFLKGLLLFFCTQTCALVGLVINAATDIIGATICTPSKKAIIGISIAAAPPAATVLINQQIRPRKNRNKKII